MKGNGSKCEISINGFRYWACSNNAARSSENPSRAADITVSPATISREASYFPLIRVYTINVLSCGETTQLLFIV
jgi:hypothetical protein